MSQNLLLMENWVPFRIKAMVTQIMAINHPWMTDVQEGEMRVLLSAMTECRLSPAMATLYLGEFSHLPDLFGTANRLTLKEMAADMLISLGEKSSRYSFVH